MGDLFLIELGRYPSLKRLTIANSNVSVDGINRLREDLPDCKVEGL